MNKTIQDYDKYAKDLANKFDRIGMRANDIKKLFPYHKKKNPRVLELGCAHGRDASEILKHTTNYIGVDASEGLLKIAKERLPQAKKEALINEFYPKVINHPRYVKGVFWWYFRGEMVPKTNYLWGVLSQAISQ